MFRFMKKLSPILSPMIASLFLFSSTVSFVQAAQVTSASVGNQPYLFTQSKTLSTRGVNALFDDDTTSRYVTTKSQLIERTFEQAVTLQNMKVFGASDYQINVAVKVNGVWVNSKAWTMLNLKNNEEKWYDYRLNTSIKTKQIRVSLIPLTTFPKGIASISFETASAAYASNHVILDQGVQTNITRLYKAIKSNADKTADSVFTFHTAYMPAQIQKATLSYDVNGVSGGASVIRAINDELSQGGMIIQTSPLSKHKAVKVTEEINPAWLSMGENKVKFFSHKGEIPEAYTVSNVKVSFTTKLSNVIKKARLVAYAPQKSLAYKEYVYLKGFVESFESKIAKIVIDGKEVAHNFGAFETLVHAKGAKKVKVTATLEDGRTLKKSVIVDTTLSQFQAKNVQISSSGVSCLNGTQKHSPKSVLALANKQTEVHFRAAKLQIKKDALQIKRDIKILSLQDHDLPELDQGMVNVTKGDVSGYRFLPHGTKFDKKNNLEIAYDESKLPKGTSGKDVKTYFFDDETGRWTPLPKIASATGVITSTTNHFTDMINAVIQTPDAPQAKAYGATQIKDLKVANPGAKINLIQAPQASSMGDAQLSYPIEIPAGRQGMSPQLRVSYSSGAANSWMGLGWNLAIPSVSIDTRWGVPRYDEKVETETYTISGQQLSPVAHRSAAVSRTSEKVFHPRVEGSFNKIIRHGDNPKNYWWEVTAKNGSKNFYGGAVDSGLEESSVLKDSRGNIAHWALTSSIDTYGNTIKYTYKTVQHSGLKNGTVPGYNLYIEHINYTGFENTDGAYDIIFERDQSREDVMIDARCGFKKVTADRLVGVKVQYDNKTLRSYKFLYKTGAFEKTLLDKIEQYDATGEHFNTHTFSYFDDIRDQDGKYIAFEGEKFWKGNTLSSQTKDSSTATATSTSTKLLATPLSVKDTSVSSESTSNSNTGNTEIKSNVNLVSQIKGIHTLDNDASASSSESIGFNRTQFIVDATASAALQQTARAGVVDLIYPSSNGELLDYVRVWKAPFDGIISIDAPLALIQTQTTASSDGVRVSIQEEGTELWSQVIASNDFSVKIPSDVSNILVEEGQVILFRVQPLSSTTNDVVSWSPIITYIDKSKNLNDANKLPLYHYNAMDDALPQSKVVRLPENGSIHLEGNISKPVSTDDVQFALIKFNTSGEQSKVWEVNYSADANINTQPKIPNVTVNANDALFALISTQSNVDFKAIKWSPLVTYYSSDENNSKLVNSNDVNVTTFKKKIIPHSTVHQSIKSSYGWKATEEGTLKVEAVIPENFEGSGNLHFTVKSEGKRLAEQDIKLTIGEVSSHKALEFEVSEGVQLYFEYYFTGDFSIVDATLWMPKVSINEQTVEMQTAGLYKLPKSENGSFYRGWAEYYYDAGNEDARSTIDPSKLHSLTSEFVDAYEKSVASQNTLEGVNSPNNTALQGASVPSNQASVYGNDAITPSSSTLKTEAQVAAQSTAFSSGLPSDSSALSGAVSENSTIHLSVTAGLFDGNLASKSQTVGGKIGSSKSQSDGTLAMVDIDGDSLPDQVIVNSYGLGYKKNLSHDGVKSFAPVQLILGAHAFHHSKTKSSNKGLEAHFGAFAGYSRSTSTTTTDIYFSDVNGDGLIDIVSNGRVHYNARNDLGNPVFSSVSIATPNPIDETGSLSAGGWIEPQTAAELAKLEEENPLHDTVRVWVAPEAGTIAISAPVNLVEDVSDARAAYATADGVRVAVQHKATELWNERIDATDYTVKNSQGLNAVVVAEGDRIYFRVNSIHDGAYDKVNWSPKITYINKTPSFDANNLALYSFDVNADFLLSGYDVTMPISGTISIDSTFVKPKTSDDVVLRLMKIDAAGAAVSVWEENTGQNAQNKGIHLTRSVQEGESYRFEVHADTNVDWTQISWKPTITYTQASNPDIHILDAAGNPQFVLQIATTLHPYSKTYKRATRWKASSTSTVEVSPKLTYMPTANGTVVFSVKRDRTLLGKQILEYRNGVLLSSQPPLLIPVTEGENLYLEYHTEDSALASLLSTNAAVEIIEESLSIEKQASVYGYSDAFLFGPMYRNWGQFVYNANDGRANQPIIESELKLDQSLMIEPKVDAINSAMDKESLEKAFENDGYDPASSIFIPMVPRADTGVWQGMDASTKVSNNTMQASRLGLKDLSDENLIPSASNGSSGVRGINQVIKTKGESYAFGGGVGPFGASISQSEQTSQTLTQFIDMNGDRYPDIVGNNQIQFTTTLGALEASTKPTNIGVPIYNETSSFARTLGGTFATGSIDTGGQQTIWGLSTQDPNAGISGNTGESTDEQHYSLRDINGDGLPDRLYKNGSAALNLGYSFTAIESWNFGTLRKSSSTSEGYGLGINIGHYSIGGGIAVSTSKNSQTHTLMDLNSDGLIDEVYLSNNVIKAKLNTGNGFTDEIVWGDADRLYESMGKSEDASATFTACIPILPFAPLAKICFNPGGSIGRGHSQDEAIFTDINGDGFIDFLKSSSASNLTVRTSTIGKTNLLKTVERPLGAKITLDYERSGNTFENPHHKWVLSEVDVFDGHTGDGADTMKQTFRYESGHYDRYEREFYGFAWVTTSDIDTSNDNAVYRKNINHFINDNYYEKGLLVDTQLSNGGNKLYVEKINAYETIDIFTHEKLTEAEKKSYEHVTFPQLVQVQTRYYEGTENAGQETALEYVYDKYGNVITQHDLGDFNDLNDNWVATVTYHDDTTNYIVSVPSTIKLYDENGNLLRDREASIDEHGAVTQVRVKTGLSTLTSDMHYDQYGNLVSIMYPQNHKGQRYALNYTLDDVVHTYTTSMSDSFGYTATAEYDYRFGAQISQTDINSQPIIATLDTKGRIKTITGPLEASRGIATITHSYYPNAFIPYALTQHYDEGRADTIDTVTFIDGLMRVIQTKKDAAIDDDKDGIALDGMSVSGHVRFDSFGRSIATHYPVSETVGNAGGFNYAIDGIAPTRTSYDILDRKLLTTLPDGATLSNTYGFKVDRAGVMRFHTLSTDANQNTAESFKDVRNRISSVLQHNPSVGQDDIWTSYSYNAVNELLEVTDDKGNLTTAVYDTAGRRTQINNQDTGLTQSIYDNAGNVITKITANLRAESKSISYIYDYNRLSQIKYPNHTDNDVSYTYGNNPALYNAGRITKITDASGIRLFEYGKLGETTKETRTLSSYTESEDKTYVTQYSYDTWNRLRTLTYPDGEVLTHTYDSGGKLSSLKGKKGKYSYNYLKALTYDKFGQRVYTEYLNNTTATYAYEKARRRLSTVVATDANRTFMDNHYNYDKMQNILAVSNAAAVDVNSSSFGGETQQNFNYDNLYQLTHAEGKWVNRQGHEHKYNLAMSYDSIGNIKTKNQQHARLPYVGDSWIPQKKTSYNWDYSHELTQPHAPSKIGNRIFTYDANGNQVGWQNTQNANKRTIEWDEENRIDTISDNGHTSYYVYDAGGERTLKRSAQGETFYVNAYFVIREGEVASKHFFAGSQRIATKLTKQESQTVQGKGKKPAKIMYEKEQYFYHPDHLGSSSFVTDEKGKVYEHLEYFPFGETFAHEHSNTQNTPYRFTGKEYDEVTGLYYYGARYYDPRTSVWQSPDPILGEYMSGQTNGGVFNPKNLNMFGYTYNNPVNLVDPDGEAVDPRLKITGAEAIFNSDVTSHNYSVEETDAAFETMSMVLGGVGFVRHGIKSYGARSVGGLGRFLGIKTTLGLGKEGLQKYYAKNLLKNGSISAKDFGALIPKGTKGTWKPTESIKLGKKYNFKVNNTKVEFKMHSPDKAARAKFSGSNSGAQWTAQIKVGNKFLGTDGVFHKMTKATANMLHIPLKLK